MKHNFKKHVTYVLFFFMMVVSACNDNKAEIYEPKTPIGINIANTSIVTEMIWDKKTVLKDGININELYFKTDQDHQHIFVAEVDLSKFAISPGTKDDVAGPPSEGQNSDAILPYHAYAAEGNGKKVWLGVNGDFYTGNLEVMGIFYKDGVKINDTPFEGHEAVIYQLRSGETYVGLSDEALSYGEELYQAVGGYGTLIYDGKVSTEQNLADDLDTDAHPRTSVGISEDRKKLYFFVVDGRMKDIYYSKGLTLSQLGILMDAVGCFNAINLDGGGSTTLIVRKESEDGGLKFPILNTPTDDNGAREITNSILVIEK